MAQRRDVHDLLFRVLRGAAPAGDAAPPTADDWREVARLASDYQLGPLVFSRIGGGRAAELGIPADVVDALRHAHRATAAANLRLFHEMDHMLLALDSREIDTIVLKGGYLALSAYGHIALRPMRDIDLMVRPADLPAAVECLRSMGYDCDDPEAALGHCANAAHAAPLTKPNAPPVELHWNIEGPHSPFRIDLGGLWTRSRQVRIGSADARVLGREDFLLHLCLHGTRHLTRDWNDATVLKGLCDVAQAIETWAPELDWDVVQSRALDWRSRNAVFVILHLAQSWLGAPVPAAVLDGLRPADLTEELLAWARERIIGAAGGEPPAVGDHVARFLTTPGLRAKAALLMREAFPARGRLAQSYGVPAASHRVYLCYPVHVAFLVARGISDGLRLLARRGDLDESARRVAHNLELRAWLQSPRG
jgi:hypothetical protein